MPRFEPMEPRLLLDAGPIVINEIMYNTSLGTPGQTGFVADNPHLEYIELYNRGSTPVDLKGWEFSQGVPFTFDPSTDRIMAAGSYLVVAADRAAFLAKYTTVDPNIVVGDWIPPGSTEPPRLSNAGEDIELEDAAGTRMDFISYGDSGDWSTRIRGPLDYNHRGVEWDNGTDGSAGKSLELRNPGDGSLTFRLSNEWGQNWGPSASAGGTPGARNSIYSADIAPVILDLGHLPAIPRHTDPVTVTAQVVDEAQANAGVTVQLYWRVDGTTTWNTATMMDDGLHGDNLAGDGTYGVVLAAQPNNAIVEMYARAVDAGGHVRTWPGPVSGDEGVANSNGGQTANALYQVDDSFNPDAAWTPGAQPIYRLIMTEANRAELAHIGSDGADSNSNAQMNGTFISVDGTGTKVRYRVGFRNRGGGSRLGTPNNYKVLFPSGSEWMEISDINLNSRYTPSQAMGSALFQEADIPAPDETPIQVRVNNQNLAYTNDVQYGSYVAKEGYSADYAANHWPDDPDGNLYLIHDDYSSNGDLRYRGTDPNTYRTAYDKQTNVSEDNFTDLMHMTEVLQNASDATFVQQANTVIDLNEWIRYIAVDTLAGNLEGGLCTGAPDDYGLYRGLIDTRFQLVPWDLDTLMSLGSSGGDTGRGIFTGYTNFPALNRILTHPDTVGLYYQQLLDLMNTVFLPANFNATIDRVLGSWVPQAEINAAKQFVVNRNASVLSQIPHGPLTITSSPPTQSGYSRVTTNSYTLSGTGNSPTTRSVLVDGQVAASWSTRYGTWSYTGTGLAPGINRILVQAFDGKNGTGNEIERTYIDIWYDTGVTNDYPKNPTGGGGGGPTLPDPTPVSITLLAPDAYLPGQPIFVRLEALTAGGVVAVDLWDGTATLASGNPAVTLSTTSVPILNGYGSALVTATGNGSFTLTATLNSMSANRSLADLTGQPVTSVSGTLSGSTVWSGIIHVTGNVTVPTGSTLTVSAGTLVLADGVTSGTGGITITVQGAIQSLGTFDHPVTFTTYGYGSTLAWGGLVHSSASPSLYQYTFINRAGRTPGQGHTGTGPAVYPMNSTVTFEHSAISDNVGKIMQADGSDLTFRDTVLARSVMGPEIGGTALLLENSFINEMRNPDDADGIYIHDAGTRTVLLHDSVIAGTDDDDVDQLGGVMTIDGCILRNSKDKGLSQYDGEVFVKYTLAIDNSRQPEDGSQAALSMKGTSGSTVKMHVDHVTIYNNAVGGIGVQCRNKYGVPVVYFQYDVTNSIIYAARPVQSDYTDTYATINVSYTDTFGDMSPVTVGATVHGTNNINTDPLFVNLAGRNLHLQAASPAVDTGDPSYAPDPDGSPTDMGYYTYDHGSGSVPTGFLTGDTVWTAAGGPYRIFGELTIPVGITLTIQPGASVFFENNCKLIVQGRLVAEGTALDPIRFTRKPGTTGWLGIQFHNTTQDNRITYAVVEWGRTNDGMIGLENSRLLVDHVTLDHTDLRRIRTVNSSLIVRNSTFTDIFAAGQAPTTNNMSEQIWGNNAPQGGRLLIENNVFGTTKGHNDALDIDGGLEANGDPVIQVLNNVFMGGGDEALDIEGDFYIEGNVFKNFHKDTYAQQQDPNGEANTISAGDAHLVGHHYTVVRNVFYEVDHAVLVKDNSYLAFLDNTVVNVTATKPAIYFDVINDSAYSGDGATIDGSIFQNVPIPISLTVRSGAPTPLLTVNRSDLAAAWHSYGTGNVDEDARVANPAGGDFHLRPGSPALDTGPNGLDMGAMVPQGASISGEPMPATHRTDATLIVAGPGITSYQWRLDGGAYSAELPVGTPISLAGLAAGPHTVYVLGKNSVGVWQTEANKTASRTWTINTTSTSIILSEVMADNVAAVLHGTTYPDLIELYNDGMVALDLGGISLSDNAALPRKFTFAAGTMLGAGERLILYADSDGTTPGIHLGFSLKDNGDDVYLTDTAARGGALLDSVVFGPQLADRSIARRADGSWGLATPTFGAANALLRTGDPSTLKINEWLADEKVAFKNDFVELYNPDPLPVNLAGLHLTDKPTPQPGKFEFVPLSFLGGASDRAFTADDDPGQGDDHLNFKLAYFRGKLGLLDSSLNVLDHVFYGPQTTDVSEGRTPNGGAAFAFQTIPTPDVNNPGQGGSTVIEETTYHLFEYNKVWSYNQTQNLDGTGWKDRTYDSSAWPTGPGLLHNEVNVTGSLAGQELTLGRMTYYFRTGFDLPGGVSAGTITHLRVSYYVDDGMVVYLNGVELTRANISGTPTYSTAATSHEFTLDGPFDIALTGSLAGVLRDTGNVLAVEVHQNQIASSDIVWGLSLDAKQVVTVYMPPTDAIPDNVAADFTNLRISEVMYAPPGGGDYEYIELRNIGAQTIDLGGVRFTNGIDFTFAAGTNLAAGAYTVVVSDLTRFRDRYGPGPSVAGVYSGNLNNAGEGITLALPAPYDAGILRFDYSGSWYPTTNGGGHSLVIYNDHLPTATWDKKASWRPSAANGGSPGAGEPVVAESLILNEVLAHQDTEPPGDWIELYNTTATDMTLNGWYLSDSGLNLQKFHIPDGTLVPAHGYKAFTESSDFGQAGDPNGFALSELGDQVYLSTVGYVDMVAFGASDRGVTIGRYVTSTGQEEFVPLSSATMEAANAYPMVGPIIINEIMYNPTMERVEYIELRNLTAAEVKLYDPAHPANTWKFTEGIDFAFPAGSAIPAYGYALVVPTDAADFRLRYPDVPPSVQIFGPYQGKLTAAGEVVELERPGDPEPPPSTVVPYYRVDRVAYDNDVPWPTGADGSGASLERKPGLLYGNDPINWVASSVDGGTPGWPNSMIPPYLAAVTLNADPLRKVRGPSAIEPSGIGVQTLTIRFSGPVAFTAASVLVQPVVLSDDGLTETPGTPITLTLSAEPTPTVQNTMWGSGTDTMTINLGLAKVVDTWVKVRVLGNGSIHDAQGHALDGESKNGSGRGYIYSAALDLPTGNGAAGGDAVFYVGSLRGDYYSTNVRNRYPDGLITTNDVDGFTAAYLAGNLDADFYSTNVRVRTPDGLITTNDVDGFTAMYLAALSSGRHLGKLLLTGGGSEGGLAGLAAAGGGGATAPLGQAALVSDTTSPTASDGALVSAAPAPSETAMPSASSGTADALGLAAPIAVASSAGAAGATDSAAGSTPTALVSQAPLPTTEVPDGALRPDGGLVDALALAAFEAPLAV